MTCNVGGADRAARVVVGVAALIVGFTLEGTIWRVLAFVVAGIALLTAAFACCPLNRMLHINTCSTKDPLGLPKYKP